MINTINKKKDSIITAAIIFGILLGYCLVAGLSLIIPLLLVFYGCHLALFKKIDARRFLHLGFLLVLVVALGHTMTEYWKFSPYVVPVASVAMLTMLLFNDFQLAFSMAFMSSAILSLAVGMPLDYCIIVFMGSLTGAYMIRDARTRGKVLFAGLLAGMVQAFGYFLVHPVFSKELFIDGLEPFFINGLLSAALVLATLKIFESLFGELTNFSLLELSDSLTQPLLKRLAFEAPGTYHHSLILSNLAGAAADAIDANALLVRVGAYYHDIGKLVNPEYFTENQMMADNKHDELEPSMSRLVILNHIKEGVEIASKNKLSPKLIDFIQQHHGTSLIYYFYQKALVGDDTGSVSEENYRYPGPKPQTKETAIVMLADSVEGATRALDEHTPMRISEMVRKVINNKFIDGQLDECSLTLREIETICGVFSRELSAMYHVRVKYPNAKKPNGHNGEEDRS
jgi:putative nucleotidyltransferase with HDIG domain